MRIAHSSRVLAVVPERHEAIAVLGVEEHAERLSAGRQLIAAIGT